MFRGIFPSISIFRGIFLSISIFRGIFPSSASLLGTWPPGPEGGGNNGRRKRKGGLWRSLRWQERHWFDLYKEDHGLVHRSLDTMSGERRFNETEPRSLSGYFFARTTTRPLMKSTSDCLREKGVKGEDMEMMWTPVLEDIHTHGGLVLLAGGDHLHGSSPLPHLLPTFSRMWSASAAGISIPSACRCKLLHSLPFFTGCKPKKTCVSFLK